MNSGYMPNTSLTARVKRRLTPYQAKQTLRVKTDQPIVSFTFDDCPKSVMQNALKPLEAEGWLSTVYMSMGRCGKTNHLGLHMSEADVKAAYESGHEIGDHTFSHMDGADVPVEVFEANIDKNQNVLAELGLPPSETFAYPYGEVTPKLKKMMKRRFKGARGITSRIHENNVDLNQIGSNRLYAGHDVKVLLETIKELKTTSGWLTIFTHDVRENPSRFGCTPEDMRAVIKAVKDVGASVMTMAEAINHLETSCDA